MTTPRRTPPAPAAGALVPAMPDDVRALLAEIGGAKFAAAMAREVWPVALAVFDEFASRESSAQRRAWLLHANEKFAAVAQSLPKSREALRREALRFVADLPIDLVSVLEVPGGLTATAKQWQAAIRRAIGHPAIARPERKGAMSESVEVARRAMPTIEAAGMALSLYERSAAVRALRVIGNAAAVASSMKPRTARHWREALSAAAE